VSAAILAASERSLAMGITIVQKSDLTKLRPNAVKALILAGGAVTGGSFTAGGLKALNDYLDDFSVNDFDIFVGISSGSMLSASLAAGIPPEAILKSFDGTSKYFSQLSAWYCYRPNLSELVERPIAFTNQLLNMIFGGTMRFIRHQGRLQREVAEALWRFVTDPSFDAYETFMGFLKDYLNIEELPSLMALFPSGVFDNRPIEEFIRKNIARNSLTNDFRETLRITGKRLYIPAMRLDTAQRVIFGPDEDASFTISQAIQASTAFPGMYKPARIRGVDYVDGGVHETADIDIAYEKGAELIICYNPFRPCNAEAFIEGFKRDLKKGQRMVAGGATAVFNQVLRAFFHERLTVGLNRFKENPSFRGDIILLDPPADDATFFALNPMSIRHRVKAAKFGFESVRNAIEAEFDAIKPILAAYGIGMSRKGVEQEWETITRPGVTETSIRHLLEGRGEHRPKKWPKTMFRKPALREVAARRH
jgi:NTE family protein